MAWQIWRNCHKATRAAKSCGRSGRQHARSIVRSIVCHAWHKGRNVVAAVSNCTQHGWHRACLVVSHILQNCDKQVGADKQVVAASNHSQYGWKLATAHSMGLDCHNHNEHVLDNHSGAVLEALWERGGFQAARTLVAKPAHSLGCLSVSPREKDFGCTLTQVLPCAIHT